MTRFPVRYSFAVLLFAKKEWSQFFTDPKKLFLFFLPSTYYTISFFLPLFYSFCDQLDSFLEARLLKIEM